MNYRIFDDEGHIINTIVADHAFVNEHFPGRYALVEDPTAPSPGMPVVPQSVTRKAARLALLNAGKFHLVQPAIDALDEPDRSFVQIEWDDSLTFERDSSTLLLLAGALDISDAELDALFIAAEALQ